MKKLLILSILFAITAISCYADEENKIVLSENHAEETIDFGFCKIFISAEDDANVNIKIENKKEDYYLILFGHAYTEKILKKQKPSVIFNKKYVGNKGKRIISGYQPIGEVPLLIPQSEKRELPLISAKNGKIKCHLPIYIAKPNKKRTKMVLMRLETIDLLIEVNERISKDYDRLKREVDDLTNAISAQTFCNHPRHSPSLEEQEKPYKEKIESIKNEIDSIREAHNWWNADESFRKFRDLKEKLDAISFSSLEQDCGKRHERAIVRPRHSCKYCKLSDQQIYNKLDNYYQKLKTRKVKKDDIMSDVKLLYSCPSWKNGAYKDKIENYYNRIVGYGK